MAEVIKVKRVANPRKRGKLRYRRTRNARTKARRTAKKRQTKRKPVIRRYTVKALKRELKRRGVKSNPKRRARVKRGSYRHRRRTRKSNPVLIELLNPRKRRSSVAKRRYRRSTRRKSNARHRTTRRVYRRRRANPMAIARHRRRYTRRRANSHRRVRRYRRSHRNPQVFGFGGGNIAIMVGGLLVGVAATKYLPTLIPSGLTSGLGTSPMIGVLLTAAGAFAAGWLAKRFVSNQAFSNAVLLGGLAQAGSQLLNIIAPPALSHALSLSGIGMGDIVPGNYVVPQNPLRPVIQMPAPAAAGMGAWRPAWRR